MTPRTVDRQLMADLAGVLRECDAPVPGRTIAGFLGISRLRSIGEAARALRFDGIGVTYIPGRGYLMAKSRKQRFACADRMDETARELHRAAAALRRGRSRQTKIPATRVRRAA